MTSPVPEVPSPDEDKNLVDYAAEQVDKLVAARVALNKFQIRILGVAVSLLIIVVGGLSYVAYNANTVAGKVQAGSVQTCQETNAARANNVKIWDTFIKLILRGDTNKVAIQEGQSFERYIASVETQRDCKSTYGISLGN